jgi:hypothetical protein
VTTFFVHCNLLSLVHINKIKNTCDLRNNIVLKNIYCSHFIAYTIHMYDNWKVWHYSTHAHKWVGFSTCKTSYCLCITKFSLLWPNVKPKIWKVYVMCLCWGIRKHDTTWQAEFNMPKKAIKSSIFHGTFWNIEEKLGNTTHWILHSTRIIKIKQLVKPNVIKTCSKSKRKTWAQRC